MRNMLTVLDRFRSVHRSLGKQLEDIDESISDLDALKHMDKLRHNSIQMNQGDVVANLEQAKGSLKTLTEALRGHFEDEERDLPSLLGDSFTRALVKAHRSILSELRAAESAAEEARLRAMDGHMESRQIAYLRMKLDNVRQLIRDHADKEEVLFEMLGTVLEDE